MASWYSSPPLLHRTKRQIARSLPGHGRSSQKLQYTGFAVLAKQLQAVQCGCMGRRWRIGGRFIRKGEEKGCKSNCCGSSRYCTANLGSIQMLLMQWLQVATHLRKYTLSGNLSPKWSLCRTPCKMFFPGGFQATQSWLLCLIMAPHMDQLASVTQATVQWVMWTLCRGT